MAKPYLPNLNEYISLGFDPKTGLPLKHSKDKINLKTSIYNQLKVLDEQNAIRRYEFDLKDFKGLKGDLLERILYFRGKLMVFYLRELDKWFSLPFTLCGTIDVYGRYTEVTPVTFGGGKRDGKIWIEGLKRKVLYEPIPQEEWTDSMLDEYCVILSDYSEQLTENIVSRNSLNNDLIDVMAECLPMARTSMIANSGIKALRVNDPAEQVEVEALNQVAERNALMGKPFGAVIGSLDFQDISSNGSAMKSEEFMLYMQALDNFRLSLYGLQNGGLFQKKAHMLESEQEMNNTVSSLVYEDGLKLRQEFCEILNSLSHLNASCRAVNMQVNESENIDIENEDTTETTENQGGDENDE